MVCHHRVDGRAERLLVEIVRRLQEHRHGEGGKLLLPAEPGEEPVLDGGEGGGAGDGLVGGGAGGGGSGGAGASSAIVWWRNRSLAVNWPAWRARETIWMDKIESPPSSKKLSWMPTWSRPRTSAQMAAMACSAGVRGGV